MFGKHIGLGYVSRNATEVLEWLRNGDAVFVTYKKTIVAEIIPFDINRLRSVISRSESIGNEKLSSVAEKTPDVIKRNDPMTWERFKEASKEAYGSDFNEALCRETYNKKYSD